MMRPPGPIRATAARAPRNVPVRLVSMTSRQAAAESLVMSGSSRDTPALAIHTSTPPNRSVIRSATASLNKHVLHVARADEVISGELPGQVLQGRLRPRDQGEPGARGVEGGGEHAAEAAAGPGDHDAPSGDVGVPGGEPPPSAFVVRDGHWQPSSRAITRC